MEQEIPTGKRNWLCGHKKALFCNCLTGGCKNVHSVIFIFSSKFLLRLTRTPKIKESEKKDSRENCGVHRSHKSERKILHLDFLEIVFIEKNNKVFRNCFRKNNRWWLVRSVKDARVQVTANWVTSSKRRKKIMEGETECGAELSVALHLLIHFKNLDYEKEFYYRCAFCFVYDRFCSVYVLRSSHE